MSKKKKDTAPEAKAPVVEDTLDQLDLLATELTDDTEIDQITEDAAEITDEVDDTEADEAEDETPMAEQAAEVNKIGLKRRPPVPNPAEVRKQEQAKVSKRRRRMGTGIPADGVHANPKFLRFPADKWGLTKDLKKSVISMASRMAGDESKKQLVDETMRILLEHVELKFEQDAKYKAEKRAEAIAKREAELAPAK